jgi:glycine oxidase
VKVAVIGAGIIGCAIAHELAARGVSVEVMDPRGAAGGATHASAGMLAPFIEGHFGPLLTLCTESLSMYDRFIERVTADAQVTLEYERGGTLQVAHDDAHAEALASLATRLAEAGTACTLLDAVATRGAEPALAATVRAGLVIPTHGYVRAAALTHALATAATRLGATFVTDAVRDVGSRPGGVVVRTADRTAEFDAVVLAAGSWTSALSAGEAAEGGPVVRPIRGQLLQLRYEARPCSHVVWGHDCYLVPWRDGTVLFGATVEDVGFDEHATVGGVTQLLRSLGRLLAEPAAARFEAVQVGLRPLTRDELPIIGASSTRSGVFYATGHYRNGILLAPFTAHAVADLVVDGRRSPLLDLVRPSREGL